MNPSIPTFVKTSKPNPSPSDEASPVAKLFHIWFSGLRVFGRFLWFLFFFIILMAPFNIVADYINPEERSFFDADGFNLTVGILLIALAIYMPFAAYFSARWSNQLLGRETRSKND